MGLKGNNMKQKEELIRHFDSSMLFVIDFSAISNIKSQDTLKALTQFLLEYKIKVAVSREFYEDYEVIIKTTNTEQKNIAFMAYQFLSAIDDNGCLLYMSNIIDSREIISKLHKNPKVCFVYYKNSEFSENVLDLSETLESKAIIIDEKGDLNIFLNQAEIINASKSIIDPSAEDDDYFTTSFEAEKGAKVKTRENEIFQLGEMLGSGGEGAVYDCPSKKGYVVKIYHKGQLNKLRLKKIFLMEKKQICYDGLCWPEKVVFSEKGEPVGYLMKKIDGKALDAILDSDESLLKAFPNWTKQDTISLAIDILQKIQYLHMFGILIGDLRLKNIVIDKTGTACLVDLDSCQVENLPCPIGFPDFTPPELQFVEFKKQLRSYYNESFSCSVLLFKVLFCGLHPYDQKNGADTIEEEISSKSFPYPKNVDGDFTRIPWGGYEDMWRHTPFQMQSFLYDIFKDGNRYNLQEMILMLKTYHQFIGLKKSTMPSLNKISFDYE